MGGWGHRTRPLGPAVAAGFAAYKAMVGGLSELTPLQKSERAAAALALQPVVVQGGAHVAEGYREVVLRPTDRRRNGGAVWGREGDGLYLYYFPGRSRWYLNSIFTPDESGGPAGRADVAAREALPRRERGRGLGRRCAHAAGRGRRGGARGASLPPLPSKALWEPTVCGL